MQIHTVTWFKDRPLMIDSCHRLCPCPYKRTRHRIIERCPWTRTDSGSWSKGATNSFGLTFWVCQPQRCKNRWKYTKGTVSTSRKERVCKNSQTLHNMYVYIYISCVHMLAVVHLAISVYIHTRHWNMIAKFPHKYPLQALAALTLPRLHFITTLDTFNYSDIITVI